MPIFEYLGPFDSTEVDEQSDVRKGETVEVDADRAPTFEASPDSWREVKKHKPKQPRVDPEDVTPENTEES